MTVGIGTCNMIEQITNFVMSSRPRMMGALAIVCFSGAALVHGSPMGALIIAGLGFAVWAICEAVAASNFS